MASADPPLDCRNDLSSVLVTMWLSATFLSIFFSVGLSMVGIFSRVVFKSLYSIVVRSFGDKMSVIGFNFKSIDASVDESKLAGDVTINSAPNILNIQKKDLGFVGMKDAVGIEFDFTTSYDPKVGNISFTGEILYQVEDAKKVADEWKKEKKLDEKIALDVLNTIFRKCLGKSVEIAETLRLPPPIRFPVVTTDKPKLSRKSE